jgi:hypothetical protein
LDVTQQRVHSAIRLIVEKSALQVRQQIGAKG